MLLSPRFQSALAAAWFRCDPHLEPIVEAAVHGALASVRRARAEAALTESAAAAAPAASGGSGSSSYADMLSAAKTRAACAVYAFLGVSPPRGERGAALPAAAEVTAAAESAQAQAAAVGDASDRATAVAMTAAAVAFQLLGVRARHLHF